MSDFLQIGFRTGSILPPIFPTTFPVRRRLLFRNVRAAGQGFGEAHRRAVPADGAIAFSTGRLAESRPAALAEWYPNCSLPCGRQMNLLWLHASDAPVPGSVLFLWNYTAVAVEESDDGFAYDRIRGRLRR